MGFIIRHDFDALISQTDIDVITGADDHVLIEAERSTQLEVKSYLRGRFDVSALFFDVKEWNLTRTNLVGEIVHLSAPHWDNQTYNVDDLVTWPDDNKVYKCIQATTSTALAQRPPAVAYWEEIGTNDSLYTCLVQNVAENLNNATYYSTKDGRDALLVRLMCDLMLYEIHSRINPRMIPEFRIQRRDDAIKYLTAVADPRKNIDPGFPLIDHGTDRGNDITFGVTTNNNAY